MHIERITKNDLGEIVVEKHPFVTTENAHTYAKRNCRVCEGRGYQTYDNGWEYYTETSLIDEYPELMRRRRNERAILCNCSMRTISKTGL